MKASATSNRQVKLTRCLTYCHSCQRAAKIEAENAASEWEQLGPEYPYAIQLNSGEWRVCLGGVLWPPESTTRSGVENEVEKYFCGNPAYFSQMPGGEENPAPTSLTPLTRSVCRVRAAGDYSSPSAAGVSTVG